MRSLPGTRCRRVLVASSLLIALVGCGGGGEGAAVTAVPPLGALPTRKASAPSLVAPTCTDGSTAGTVYRNAEVEPIVVAAPGQPNRLIAAWQQDRLSDGGSLALVTAASDDGGASWQRTLQPMSRCGGAASLGAGDDARSTDPWVDIAPNGTAFLLGLSFSGRAFNAGSTSAMLASRSTDGGRTWSAPATLLRDAEGFFNDKGSLTADPTDARFVYAVWDRLDASGRGPSMLARSGDGGITWEVARPFYTPTSGGISQTLGNRIVVLTAGPERGLLVNVFTQLDTLGNATTSRLGVLRSSDHGQTWGAPVFISDLRAVGTHDPRTGHAVRDGAELPGIATGPDGGLWVTWQDARFSGGQRDAIALSRSTDGGRTWSAPQAINRVPGAAAFTSTLQVRADGTVGVLHYDLRNNAMNDTRLLADAWLLTSRDGVSWAETHVAGPFDLAAAPDSDGYFLGDYQGLSSSDTAFLPVLVLTSGDATNPTDVYAPSIEVLATAQGTSAGMHRARSALVGELPSADFNAAQQNAVRQVMERRLPGWAARVRRGSSPTSDSPGARPGTER